MAGRVRRWRLGAGDLHTGRRRRSGSRLRVVPGSARPLPTNLSYISTLTTGAGRKIRQLWPEQPPTCTPGQTQTVDIFIRCEQARRVGAGGDVVTSRQPRASEGAFPDGAGQLTQRVLAHRPGATEPPGRPASSVGNGRSMTAVQPEISVTEPLRSLEVRWILQGQLQPAVTGWFARFPAEVSSREDTYLVDPQLGGLSVKLRGGRALEVKVYRGSPGSYRGLARRWPPAVRDRGCLRVSR